MKKKTNFTFDSKSVNSADNLKSSSTTMPPSFSPSANTLQMQSMEEEEELQMKVNPSPIQRMEEEEEEELQMKVNPSPIQRMEEEEEELQMKVNPSPIQRMEEEEEELQMKVNPSPIQRMEEEEEEELQMKAGNEAGGSISTAASETSMPAEVQDKMESSFGSDFSNVNIYSNSQKAQGLGAYAFAQGNDVHFAPGQYNPKSQAGQELLGHELTHVVQQREGRVSTTMQKKGANINNDSALENEADVLGKKAADGKTIK